MMAIGMTYEQYWYEDVRIVGVFLKADKLRQERENMNAWLQGMYIYDAIGRLAPILHAFAPKGTKPVKYLEKPYDLEKKEDDPEKTAQYAENERLRAIMFFKQWAKDVGKQFH